MEKQVIDLLMKINDRLEGLENDVKDMKSEVSGIKNEQKSFRKEMEDRFDVTDMKLNAIETKVIHVSRKLDTTTDQVTRNLESIEEMKFKLQ